MASSLVVPVIDVQNDNFKELWPAMVVAMKTSSFIALDTELSGLGNRKSLLAESIEDRYKAICHAARSRSIISLGLACYKKLDNKAADTYMVQVYNLTLLCSEEYIIEPQSVQFLVQHGFDFNKQYGHGIPYIKGNNKGGSDNQGVHIRALFTELLRAKKPLVLHNGLIDMAFLYQSFYAHLPERLDTFTADLSEMFPAGIYDTKYVTEFELRLIASYLEYAYKKCKLENSRSLDSGATGPHVQVEFCQYVGHMSSYVDFRVCPTVASPDGQTEICQRFSAFGWCPDGNQCPLSHDTDLIILQDEKSKGEKRRKRKRQKEKMRSGGGAVVEDSSLFDGAPENKMPHMEEDPQGKPDDEQSGTMLPSADINGNNQRSEVNTNPESEGNGVCEAKNDSRNSMETAPAVDETNKTTSADDSAKIRTELSNKGDAQKKTQETGTHRAGFDAFMTGYIFAYSCIFIRKKQEGGALTEEQQEAEQTWLPTCLNKVYLSGKAVPLNIVKSTFARSSRAHVQKMEMVWGSRT
ncbi:target of EGR1 protein 1 [Sphaeramia orbicularis]|uniref:Target of EGR1 protein 1 n=1 Tax=Sphaeramia orbicularis TaxID=375764 RepID=A0A673APG2_9TELE|nr:target of EGR1 protein 1 [Sphaeramia orbicularis]